MHTALEVASWFLNYNDEKMYSDGADYISNLKLQKLLYYAQGTFLAITDSPLFEDAIEAWMHGPVVPSVYHAYKNNGDHGIEPPDNFDPSIFSNEETELLTEVYDEFGQYSAWKLRNMTHEETPWKATPQGSIIPTALIKDYFKEHYVE